MYIEHSPLHSNVVHTIPDGLCRRLTWRENSWQQELGVNTHSGQGEEYNRVHVCTLQSTRAAQLGSTTRIKLTVKVCRSGQLYPSDDDVIEVWPCTVVGTVHTLRRAIERWLCPTR